MVKLANFSGLQPLTVQLSGKTLFPKVACHELISSAVPPSQVQSDATKIAKETEDANFIAAQVAVELEKALPALQEAEAALNVLTKKDISELKVGPLK